jgi:hypothetical protein
MDSAKVDEAVTVAAVTEILFLLSGKQFGVRSDVYEPALCPNLCWIHAFPGNYEEGVTNRGRIELAGPAVVSSVTVNGAALSPASYRVEDGRYLRRLDAGWPCSGVHIDYTWGKPVPNAGVLAAQQLACELAKSVSGSGSCKLPARVQSLTRQGVTMTILDPQDFLDNGRTGLYFVDLFLAAVNPTGKRRRATIASPDISRGVRP